MERRRKAFGKKKASKTPDRDVVKSTRRSSSQEDSKSCLEDKNGAKGQPVGSVTPKQKTLVQAESPCSPMLSPSAYTCNVFPGALASPEIEVSWDWSCSQVPKDMLPLKKPKRVTRAQTSNLATLNMFRRPWPPRQQQISEEENQRRLEFYKNILAVKTMESPKEVLYNSPNNNLDDIPSEESKSCDTPKRPNTRLSASKKKNEDLFDDSANEFMIECSQAIEEKLKNGEIDMGPIVDLQISKPKRLHSPGIESKISHKKSCHGRINLFPDNKNHEYSNNLGLMEYNNNLDSSKAHINKNKTTPKSSENTTKPNNNKLSSCSSIPTSQARLTHVDTTNTYTVNYSTYTVRITPTKSSFTNNNSTSHVNLLTIQQAINQRNCSTYADKKIQQPKSNSTNLKGSESDLSSLLDDDFDMELSNLDVDSLCRNHDTKPVRAMVSAPKLCTQQEIEAKRQAALQKLMKKKRR